jgi:hypothetical protein
MPPPILAHIKLLAFATFRHRPEPPSDEDLVLFAQAHLHEDLSLAELTDYLRQEIESIRQKDADQQKALRETLLKRKYARETLHAALAEFRDTRSGPQIAIKRRALLDAIESAREAFRFAFAAERKKLTRGNRPAALATEPVISLDKAAGLDRRTNAIQWHCQLATPWPSFHQLKMAVEEIEARYAQLQTS